MNDTITKFLEEQTCATLCCSDEAGNPYCFSCYYAFNKKEGLLYFKTSPEAYHSVLLKKHPVVGGTVLPDKLNKLLTKGIQLQGEYLDPLMPVSEEAAKLYHKRFPMAHAVKGEVFTIRLDAIKMTDSTLGFGKKITWNRNEKEI